MKLFKTNSMEILDMSGAVLFWINYWGGRQTATDPATPDWKKIVSDQR